MNFATFQTIRFNGFRFRSRIKTYILVAMVLVLTLSVQAQDGYILSVSGGARYGFMGTAYELYAYEKSGNSIQSRLEFPEDGVSGAVRLGLTRLQEGRESWDLRAELSYRLTQPAGVLANYDWFQEVGRLPILWSYTESPVTSLGLDAELLFSWHPGGKVYKGLFLQAGYVLHHLDQTGNGYKGWQSDLPNRESPNISISTITVEYLDEDPDAIRYVQTTHGLVLGSMIRIPVLPVLGLELSGAYLPSWVSDQDDHLMRKKITQSQGLGHGWRVGAAFELKPFKAPGYQPFLRMEAGIEGLWMTTKTSQRWYGNDPFTIGDDTGKEIGPMKHTITSLRGSIGILLGVAFGGGR
jgi:hypothetical protein